MASKMTWERKLTVWDLGWIKDVPIGQIRTSWKSNASGEAPAWATVSKVMKEFLELDESQSLVLPDALRVHWRRWADHLDDLRNGVGLLRGNLVFEQRDTVGASYVELGLPTRYKLDDTEATFGTFPRFSWKADQQGSVEVVFREERQNSVKDLRVHTGEEKVWDAVDAIRGKVAEGIAEARKGGGSRAARGQGLQRLAASIAEGLDKLSFVGPNFNPCRRCPRAAPGVFPHQRRNAALQER